ncbi:MAG: hypothetical protein II630_07180, partial [Bacteroidales bacterium]|nr:hypothetical protein [Bacteroidales bacterium]
MKKVIVADKEKFREENNKLNDLLINNKEVDGFTAMNQIRKVLATFEEKEIEDREDFVASINKGECNEVINKIVENELAKRAVATPKPVDTANDPEIAKKFANCILDALINGKQGKVIDAMKLVVSNDVSGLRFPTEVETEIKRAWTRSERILALFNRTVRAQIPYTAQEDTDNDVLAHIQQSPDVEKLNQNLQLQYIELKHRYIYKKQRLTKEQIAEMRNAGTEVATLAELYGEMTQQLANMIVRCALLTGAVKDGVVFMTPIARTTTDLFVNVSTMAGVTPTVLEVRTGADEVISDTRKVALMHTKVKTALATLAANTTGRTFMPESELLAELGVDEIITNNILGNAVIILSAEDAYAIGRFGTETYRWQELGYNNEYLMVEALTCGSMIKPRGAAVVLPPRISLTIASGVVTVTTGTLTDGVYRMLTNAMSENITLASGSGSSTLPLPDGTYRVISDGSAIARNASDSVIA